MQVKTILNRIQKHSSFVYTDARFAEGEPIELEIDNPFADMAGD